MKYVTNIGAVITGRRVIDRAAEAGIQSLLPKSNPYGARYVIVCCGDRLTLQDDIEDMSEWMALLGEARRAGRTFKEIEKLIRGEYDDEPSPESDGVPFAKNYVVEMVPGMSAGLPNQAPSLELRQKRHRKDVLVRDRPVAAGTEVKRLADGSIGTVVNSSATFSKILWNTGIGFRVRTAALNDTNRYQHNAKQ